MNKIKLKLDKLNTIIPSINDTIHRINESISGIEEQLINIKISGSAFLYTELNKGEQIDYYIAYGRINKNFCIHIKQIIHNEDNSEVTKIYWSNCDRETILKAYCELPILLENIIDQAKSLIDAAEITTPLIKELLGNV